MLDVDEFLFTGTKSRSTRPVEEECHDPGETEHRQPVDRHPPDSCEVGIEKHRGNRHDGDIGGPPKIPRRWAPQRGLTPCAENDIRRHVEQVVRPSRRSPTVAFPDVFATDRYPLRLFDVAMEVARVQGLPGKVANTFGNQRPSSSAGKDGR
jgi:hypothetical protein